MARQRRKSDETYNVRRRAKRYVASLEREIAKTQSAAGRRALRKYARNITRQMKRTYRGSGYNVAKATQVLVELIARKTGMTGQSRANYVFRQQIGIASRGGKSSIGGGYMGQAKTKIFYRATQRFWEGAPAKDRNKLIMAALGTDSLAEAFDMVMARQKLAVKAAQGNLEPIEDTEENVLFAEGLVSESTCSPDYLDYVKVMR